VDILTQKAIRAGANRMLGYGGRSLVRLGSLIILARLLAPSDFGIIAMVTVLTGTFEIFSTGGLSAAAVQRQDVSDAQTSSLFWVNLVIGLLLAALCGLAAPVLRTFYHEPTAGLVMAAMGPAFIFTAAGVQHIGILQRELRFATLSALEFTSEALSAVIGVVMALRGWGFWALVVSALTLPLFITIGAWAATGWIPGLPRRDKAVGSMLRFGGTLTLNNLVVYAGYNFEKLLLGRFCGPDVLGLYSRAYELINLPTRILNSAVGIVAFSALSRLQGDPVRFKSFFLRGYSLVLSLTLPATIFCAALADEIILVVLGPRWTDAVLIFQLLAPTILVFAIINPFAWFLQSAGHHRRSLNLAFVIAPIAIASYIIGLPYGVVGVATAYSVAMCLWAVPHVIWCLHRTPVTLRDLVPAVGRPLLAGTAAAIVAATVDHWAAPIHIPVVRLLLATAAMLATYAWVLLVAMKQKDIYRDLFRTATAGLQPPLPAHAEVPRP
jgi:O-antigen/teichoic acid export membrane protein